MFVFKKEFTMTETTTPTAISTTTTATASRSLVLQLAAGAALGLAVFYGVAFAESPLLHNAAHDVRHITVQPCH
jgi:cobalt transporter subunit CbtB